MAFFQCEDTDFWYNGSAKGTEQEAIDEVKHYYKGVTRLRLMQIELPVPNVDIGVDI